MHILLQQFLFISLLAAVMHMLSKKSKGRDMVFMVLAFIPMWYVHSMVNIITLPDLSQYEKMFGSVRNMTWLQSLKYEGAMEAGYVAFNKLISLVTPSFQVFLGICSFLLLFMYFYSFRKYSPYIALSVIILLATTYNMSIYVLRQYLAVAVFVASFPLILQRKMVPFVIVCFLNFFIHKTAILCVPVYFIYNLNPKMMITSMAFFTFAIFLSADVLMLFSIETLGDYQKYIIDAERGQSWVPAAIAGIEFGIYSVLMWKKLWDNDLYKLIFVLLALFFLVNVAIIGRVGTLSRLTTFYGTASLFALPIIIKESKEAIMKVVAFIVILFLKVYPTFFGSSSFQDLAEMKFVSMF